MQHLMEHIDNLRTIYKVIDQHVIAFCTFRTYKQHVMMPFNDISNMQLLEP